MKLTLLVGFLLMSLSPFTVAEDLDRGAAPFKEEGIVIRTSPIRDAPPHGLFNLFLGKEIESTIKGSTVKIIGRKTYGGFSGINVWYLLGSANDLTILKNGPLWVYGGVEGESPQIKIQDKMKGGG